MLVGRERELRELDGAIAQLSSPRGALFMVVGEPGIGKTRLATETAAHASERGVRIAWGRCWEGGGAPAYWPWREGFESLGLAFPETAVGTDPTEARFALFRQVAAVLAAGAAERPILIVLEDVHAADRSSLLLLEFLTRMVLTSPVLVIATYRDLEASLRPEVSDALVRVGRSSSVLQLARLREEEVAAVVHEAIEQASDQLVASVYDTTHGNPLFVTEIVRQVRAGVASTTIPLGVREIIRQRIGLLSASVRRALDAAAVLGVEFNAAHVARMVPDADALLGDAVRTGFLIARGPRLRFSHALYRESIYQELAAAPRRALHREAARALMDTAPLAELAHHLLEAGPDSAAEAVDHAIRAALHALKMFAFEDAIAIIDRARLAIPEDPLRPALLCRVTIALGEVRLRSGDASGRELCVEAAAIARELGDATLLAQAGLAYGSVFSIGGVDPILVGILEEAFAKLPVADTGLRARTMARLASARQPSAPPLRQRDIDLALESIEVGRRVASRAELLEILPSACGALYGAAEPRLRMPISKQVEELALELGDLPRVLAARVRLASDYLELADFTAYSDLADRYEELAKSIGPAATPWRVPLMRSMLALVRARFAESEKHQAESRAIDGENPRAKRAQAFHRLCFLRAAERHAELRASIAELRGLWMQMPYGAFLAEPRVAAMHARIGDDEEVRAIMARIPADAYVEHINTQALAEAIWCTANREQAARLLPHAEIIEHRWMLYWLDVEIAEPTSRFVAYLAGIAGDWDACDRRFAASLREVEGIGHVAMAARMRFELGDLLVRVGREPERARTLLGEAREAAAALGLSELVAMIDRRHAGLRGEPRRITARPRFGMMLEGEYFAIATTGQPLRFKATRGMHYLARLVERAGDDVHVLELVGSTDADRGDAGELIDSQGRRDYRLRLEQLREAAEDAETLGDVDRAERAREDMEAIAHELARGTAPGGRAKRAESAVDRARSAVQRRIKDALDRITDQDADLGTWLRRVVHTGNYCSYRGSD